MDVDIFALTDSHQEARNLASLLSEIYRTKIDDNNSFLVLDCGDLFKGVYDRDLSVNIYSQFAKLMPQAKIFITLGNNDFGFDCESFKYLKNSISQLQSCGIEFVCANLVNIENNEYSDFVPRYKIVKINGKKILITGFCVEVGVIKNFGLKMQNYKEAFLDLINSVNENYDHIIVLNHHWLEESEKLYDFAQKNGINISLIIGGHEHSAMKPDYKRNIYYPFSFAQSLYKMKLSNKIENIKQISVKNTQIIEQFNTQITKYEQETELFKPIFKRVLNLWKNYSNPCPLGTFLSDNIKLFANTDIAFHSTGMTMYHLKTGKSDVITNYDFKRVICATSSIVKLELNTKQLKKVFENATSKRYDTKKSNPKFLQCSHNISIDAEANLQNKTYNITQISVNGEKLLDKNGNPINPDRKFTCAMDEFIAQGGQGFKLLKEIPHQNLNIGINQILKNSLKQAQEIYEPDTQYPPFVIND